MTDDDAQGFQKLEVYRRSEALIKPVYELTLRLPELERRGLADQMRRACRAIPPAIAEGYGRRSTPKEFCRYLSFGVGSANEMQAHLSATKILGYAPNEECDALTGEYQIVGKQLTNLIKYWRGRDTY